MQVEGKIAVVTGANSGIGRATLMALAKSGCKAVAAVDVSDGIRQICSEWNKEFGKDLLFPYVGDVTNPAFRQETFADLKKRFGAVHICVPAAGIVRDGLSVRVSKETGKAELYSPELFHQTINLNLIGASYWAMEALASVAEDRARRGLKKWVPDEHTQGCIVFIGSVSSHGNKGQISYAASKAALEGVSKTLAKEAIFHGVRVAIIHPGFTDTPMLSALGREYLEKTVLPNTQLGRLLRPDEIADGILFLIKNSAISGALWADAGWHPAA